MVTARKSIINRRFHEVIVEKESQEDNISFHEMIKEEKNGAACQQPSKNLFIN